MNFPDRVSRKSEILNFIKILPVEAKLFHADRETDGRTDMTKLIVDFPNFVTATERDYVEKDG